MYRMALLRTLGDGVHFSEGPHFVAEGLLFEALHQEHRFACINFHQPFSSFAVIRSASARDIPKIYTCHSLSFEEYLTRNRAPERILTRPLFFFNVLARKFMEKKALSVCDKITVLSRFTANKLDHAYRIHPKRIRVIPGGVNLTRFSPALDKVIIRERLGMPRNRMVLRRSGIWYRGWVLKTSSGP